VRASRVEPMKQESDAGALAQHLECQGVKLDAAFAAALEHLARRLLEENRKRNLTAIRDYEGILVRHYLDCLMPWVRGWKIPKGRGCDIGTGAGFPGLVYALMKRDQSWTLVESKINKISWLRDISAELALSNVTLAHGRAEALGRDPAHRERYDLCLARAVAKGTVMLEYSLPLLGVGGELWTWQGEDCRPELWEDVLRQLGGELKDRMDYVLPESKPAGRKQVLRVVKRYSTPEGFPRRTGIPQKRPL